MQFGAPSFILISDHYPTDDLIANPNALTSKPVL